MWDPGSGLHRHPAAFTGGPSVSSTQPCLAALNLPAGRQEARRPRAAGRPQAPALLLEAEQERPDALTHPRIAEVIQPAIEPVVQVVVARRNLIEQVAPSAPDY